MVKPSKVLSTRVWNSVQRSQPTVKGGPQHTGSNEKGRELKWKYWFWEGSKGRETGKGVEGQLDEL